MKIGILTHHYVKNYGAFLQMKGLYEYLRAIYPNDQVVIVNYVNRKHLIANILHVLHYRLKIDTPLTYLQKVRQLFTFAKYEHTLPRTRSVHTASEVNALGLDLLILGSDEIWNLHGSGYHPLKYGYGLSGMKAIAYAPSVGAVTEKSSIPDEVSAGLKSLSLISGRDDETIKFVARATGKSVVKMLDPTFLHNFDLEIEAEGILRKPFRYILIYDCKLTRPMEEELCRYATAQEYRILGAGDFKKFYNEINVNLTPYEWINLFRNAEKVVTGTFHGTVFSIKYHRDVVAYPTEKNRINKIRSLLSDMGMEYSLLELGQENTFNEHLNRIVDYEIADRYINQKQMDASKFLLGEYVE